MLTALGMLIGGAVVLYLGAEAAVRGAAGLARAAGISAFVLGALLFGVDLEGLGAALVAAGRGETSIAAGEVFGTVLFLYSAAFGVALLLAREPVPSPPPLMVLLPAVPMVAASAALYDRVVTRPEAVFLLLLYAGYVVAVVLEGRLVRRRAEAVEHEAAEGPRSRGIQALFAAGGLGLLYLGATVAVAGGARLVAETDLLAGFVGAAILGALVSLDEVLLEVLPLRRGAPELATGNLLGTLAAFTSGVLGLAALVRPLVVDGAANLAFLGAAGLYAIVATAFLARGRAGRGLGVVVLAAYAGWLFATASV